MGWRGWTFIAVLDAFTFLVAGIAAGLLRVAEPRPIPADGKAMPPRGSPPT
jgi:hypothetical protein